MADLTVAMLHSMQVDLDSLDDSNPATMSPFSIGECRALVDMAGRCVAAEQALAEYGRHKVSCPLATAAINTNIGLPACSCGFRDVRAALAAGPAVTEEQT